LWLLLQVLVNAQARCLDLATALILDSSVMLLVSPSMKQPLLQRLDKYIFPADDVTVADVSERCGMLTIMGPQADDVMQELAGVRVIQGVGGLRYRLRMGLSMGLCGAPVNDKRGNSCS
jgi:folate-binding Fe-S cluster repair protein YgfZ